MKACIAFVNYTYGAKNHTTFTAGIAERTKNIGNLIP